MISISLKRRVERMEKEKPDLMAMLSDTELDTAIDELQRSIAGDAGPFPFLSSRKYQALRASRMGPLGGGHEQ